VNYRELGPQTSIPSDDDAQAVFYWLVDHGFAKWAADQARSEGVHLVGVVQAILDAVAKELRTRGVGREVIDVVVELDRRDLAWVVAGLLLKAEGLCA
jgi:hypothetical protein